MSTSNVYPPPPEFIAQANVKGMEGYRELYQRAAERPEEFWAELAERELFWFQKWSHVFEWNPPFAKWFVGRKDQRLVQLHRPAPDDAAKEQDRDSLGRRAGRPAADLVPGTAPAGVPLCECPEGPGTEGGRSGHHLHGDGPGAAGGAAGVRAAGDHAFGGVRRLFGGGAQGAHSGSGSGGGDHGGRSVAARQGSAAQGRGGRGADGLPEREGRDRLPADGRRDRDEGRARPLVAHARRRRERGLPGRAARQRASAVRAVHVGDHGQAQGHRAHDGGVPACRRT